ncbi:MAG TPA: sigma-70 family RNA polymerase sigma factor [Vicinamibacteria bacterium]|jgi:RNA polymerase sigma-70 factor (ECF subfamily)
MTSLAYAAPSMERSGEADSNLVVRARDGDRDAFAEIVRSYQRRIYAVAMRMTRRHEVADDITQDTFVRAYRSLSRFELGRPLQPWLTRIAVNLAINYLNGVAKRERPLSEDYESRVRSRETEEPLDANPERALESEELARDLEEAVAKLPLEQRTVFLLKVVEEMRYEEIANLLGISEGTVMSRLSRARGRLKVMLAAHVAPIVPLTKTGGTF